MLTFRPMELDDLGTVAEWLGRPHVAPWWLAGSTVEREIGDLRLSITGAQAVHALVVCDDEDPIGWCQWYLCADDPEWAADVGAQPGDVGIDYAIGEADHTGRGVGTDLVGGLVRLARAEQPGAGVVADPHAANVASRRVLEKNGFELVGVMPVPSEPNDEPMAIYRRPPDV